MFGDLVRIHRRRQGLTQEELAERTGINVRTVGKIEANKIAAPRPATVGLLAAALKLAGADRDRFFDAAAPDHAAASLPRADIAGRTTQNGPAQLPADVAGFVGRGEQLDVLTSLADRVDNDGENRQFGAGGAVVITAIGGTAGVGKTALAVRWAHRVRSRFPDGQLYVNLRGYDPGEPMSATDALAGFLRALGVRGTDVPPSLDERAAAYRTLLAGRRVLLLLDNASTEEQVRPLLPGTASCVAVITSRDSLTGLVAREGARRIPVDVLSLADSVALLRAMIGPRVDADLTSAAALAEQAARLPLALRVAAELAASRPTTPLADLVTELGDEQRRLNALDAGSDDRTRVGVVFSWSYRSLPAEAARMFRLLGLHPATDVTPYAAAALADTSVDYAGLVLGLLARAHLIQPTAPDRYGMHDLLRAYASSVAGTVESEVERHAALTRLFDHYLATAAEATDTLHPGERQRRPVVAAAGTPSPPVGETAQAFAWLDAELSTLTRICTYTAAHGWPEHTIQFSAVLYRHLNVNGHPESQTIHAAARDAARRIGNGAAEGSALVRLGIEFGLRSETTKAEQMLLDGIDLARRSGDLVTEGMGLGALGIMCWRLGRYPETLTVLQQGLDLHRRSGDGIGESAVLQNLGILHFLQGRWHLAHQHLTAALARAEQIGFRDTEVNILCSLADVHVRRGHYDEAADCLDRAMAFARAMGDRMGEITVLRDLGQLRMRQGRYDEAVEPLLTAIAVYQPLGMHESQGLAMSRLGEVRLWQGDHAASVDLLEQALVLFRTMGEVAEECVALTRLGRTRHAMGQLDDAASLLTDAITLAVDAGLPYDEAVARAAVAEVRLTRGERGLALDELQLALALCTELQAPEADEIGARIAKLAATVPVGLGQGPAVRRGVDRPRSFGDDQPIRASQR